ncbi:MAG TPA: hypothetical protein VK151_14890, partial [Fluviicola sp.]|nr:hypothetical protein [Fluviicola sp.]
NPISKSLFHLLLCFRKIAISQYYEEPLILLVKPANQTDQETTIPLQKPVKNPISKNLFHLLLCFRKIAISQYYEEPLILLVKPANQTDQETNHTF